MKKQKNGILSDTHALLDFCSLSPSRAPYPIAETAGFPVLLPLEFAGKIEKRNWFDPLLLQVLPRGEEHRHPPGYSCDPVGDGASLVTRGLLHKYHGRMLLLASDSCPLHCRYCFRREKRCAALPADGSEDRTAFRHIQKDRSIHEVILSGGDPLTLSNRRLQDLIQSLCAIDHISTIRIHTRTPTVLPRRINSGLLRLLSAAGGRCRIAVVLHVNHHRELDRDAADAVERLQSTGALLLNQSVLLKQVNDSPEALSTLSQRLVALGVLPYYLHQLDRVLGSHHFEVPVTTGKRLIAELRKRLPGYAVPRYVREVPGESGKRVIR